MKFIKKPIAIEAVQFNGKNDKELGKFIFNDEFGLHSDFGKIKISTLEGIMTAGLGDWIIKGVNGEFYPCKPDIFEKTYVGEDKMGEISDGYHTFNELYDHRITLWIALCNLLKRQENSIGFIPKGESIVWRSKRHSDGELAFGGTWFVLGIRKEEGNQMTYHLPIGKWDETNFAEDLEKAPEFDGHSSSDVLERLKNL